MVQTTSDIQEPGSDSEIAESDFLAIIDIIHRLQDCYTRDRLEICFQNTILPLFNCQVFTMAWMDFDFSARISRQNRPFFTVNFPVNEVEVFNHFLQYNRVYYESFPHSSRVAMAHDVDFPRSALQQSKDMLLVDHPQYTPSRAPFLHSVNSMLAITDQPDMKLASSMFRTGDNDTPFAYREIRLAELLQPSLAHTLRAIAVYEELQHFRALVDVLADSRVATAMVNESRQLTFANLVFTEATGVSVGDLVPDSLQDAFKLQIRSINERNRIPGLDERFSFYHSKGQTWRVEVVQIQAEANSKPDYVLRLYPLVESYVKSVLHMREIELTHREMEIALLLKDGYLSKDIAERLFVSENTVKTHIKNIHKKFGTNSRANLVASLNRD